MAITAQMLKEETTRTCHTGEQLQRRRTDMQERGLAVDAECRRQGRTATQAEREESLAYLVESERIGDLPLPGGPSRDSIGYEDEPHTAAAEFIDQRGRRLHALRPNERLADLPQPDNRRFTPLSLGKAIVGLVSGKWNGARAEKLAMSEGGNVVGGYLFGDAFSTGFIDMARAQTRVIQAGAVTIPWPAPSDVMIMARVASDPTFSVVPENEIIPSSQPNFDQVLFNAVKIACLVPMSRELAEDAPNAASIVETVLAKSFAAELDRLALVGTVRPTGLLNKPGVGNTGSVGAIEWADIHNMAVAVRAANFEPTGYIVSPTIGGDLDIIQAGITSVWLGPPPSLNGVPRFTTTNCPDANGFCGDFSQLAIGIRTDAMLEVTTSAGYAFEKHQVLVKLTFRGDIGVLHSGAFQTLSGITT